MSMYLLLARLMGQYCFACWRLSSVVVVCNAAGGWGGRLPGAWAVRRPTLHGRLVWLRPVRAIACYWLLQVTRNSACIDCILVL